MRENTTIGTLHAVLVVGVFSCRYLFEPMFKGSPRGDAFEILHYCLTASAVVTGVLWVRLLFRYAREDHDGG